MRHLQTLRSRSQDNAVVPFGLLHHVMFACMAFFMIQQQLVTTGPALTGGPWVAQALHYQPRTPPPTLDPEQLNVEDAEWLDEHPVRMHP